VEAEIITLLNPMQVITDSARLVAGGCAVESEKTLMLGLIGALVNHANELYEEARVLPSRRNPDLLAACVQSFLTQADDPLSPWIEDVLRNPPQSVDWQTFLPEMEGQLPNKVLAGLLAVTLSLFVEEDKLVSRLRREIAYSALTVATRRKWISNLHLTLGLMLDLLDRDFSVGWPTSFWEQPPQARKLLIFLAGVVSYLSETRMLAGELDATIDALRAESSRLSTDALVDAALAQSFIDLTEPLMQWRPTPSA
jgi:hypothetical protein